MRTIKPRNKGFSLLELSVVLVIIGIIIYMLLVATTAQLEQGRVNSTKEKMAKIQAALIVFYQVNNRLPCPADATMANTSANATFGQEVSSSVVDTTYNDSSCSGANFSASGTLYGGTIPTRTLGLSDDMMMDSWGDRFTYIVSKPCIDPDDWSGNFKYGCTSDGSTDGDLIGIIGRNGAAYPWPTKAAFVLISYGKDKIGSYARAGGTQQFGPISNPAEINNGNLVTGGTGALGAALANTFYYDLPINDGDIAANYYDDITLWNTAAQVDYYAKH